MNELQSSPLFELLEFSSEVEEGSEDYLRIKELFDCAKSLDDLINGWMERDKKRGIDFISGSSDFEEPVVFVTLKIDYQPVAIAQCTKANLISRLGQEFTIDDANCVFDDECFDQDQEWTEKCDSALGVKYNELYYEDHIPRENVEKYMMSYLGATKYTGIEIFMPDNDSLLDGYIPEDKLDEVFEQMDRYVCMGMSVYESKEMDCAISRNVAFLM